MGRTDYGLPGLGAGQEAPGTPVKSQPVQALQSSNLYQEWRDQVIRDDNDFIVAIAASSQTTISGTGKTTLAIQLAQQFDNSDTGFDAEKKASLDSEHIAEDLYPDLPQQSAIVFDEAQGTLGSEGVDSRKAMANAVIRMARAAATFRYKQHSLVIVAQSTQWLDSRMMDLIDRLVLIQEKKPDDEYARAIVFDHYRDDLPSNSSASEYTPAIEDIYWEPSPANHGDAFQTAYEELHELKERTAEKNNTEDDGVSLDLNDPQREKLARLLVEEYGWSQRKAAEFEMVDRSQPWVSQEALR